MKKIRVLLVDDSAVIRKVLGDLIAADPELEVAGTAANGNLALEQLQLLQPDIVTMDIEMPEMDGPNALQDLLTRLPATLQVPILLVQHMPPLFTKLLADRLGAQAKVPVVEAVEGQEIKAGTTYIAPGGLHMEVKRVFGRVIVALHEGRPENSCRPAVDVLFRSVAKVYGADSLGGILTGMGQDGLNGSKHIKQAGGAVIAQEREGCAVWGMPGAVVDAGLASGVLSLQDIASEIVKRGVSGRDALASSEQRV